MYYLFQYKGSVFFLKRVNEPFSLIYFFFILDLFLFSFLRVKWEDIEHFQISYLTIYVQHTPGAHYLSQRSDNSVLKHKIKPQIDISDVCPAGDLLKEPD